MAATPRIQAIIRLKPELMARVRRTARKTGQSFNGYIETLLEKQTESQIPQLPSDFKVSESILKMKCCSSAPTQEMLDSDPKLAYLWEKYVQV